MTPGVSPGQIRVVIDPSLGPSDRDTYSLSTVSSQLVVSGSSGVAASLGYGNYLKQYGGCQVAWSGTQCNLTDHLPVVQTPVQVTTNDRYHYYSNVCTFSYTYVWWDWARWQKELDWMALNGVNLPLAFTGQEAITQKVCQVF